MSQYNRLMPPLPRHIYTADSVRRMDRYAIESLAVPGYELMTRAGRAALVVLRAVWPVAARVAVVCGAGNNAGDGYVLARLAREAGLTVDVMALGEPQKLRGDARQAFDEFVATGGEVHSWAPQRACGTDVIVDAILGTGLDRPLEGAFRDAIEEINVARRPVLAIDVPSGLNADTGEVLGAAVRADRTVSFVGLKLGFYVGAGPDCTGIVVFDGLDLPPEVAAVVAPAAVRLDVDGLSTVLAPRHRTTHKGQQGHVLVVAGGAGMGGAARLAGEACLRAGAGLVTVATRAGNVPAILAGRPELICRAVEAARDLEQLTERADVIAVGPGLGQDSWAQCVFDVALATDKPTVVDADALNLLAASPRRSPNWVLTPHPGEAGRLLGITAEAVHRDRLAAVRSLAARYGGIVVLKGAGSLVYREGELPAVCDRGNPGMASAGMGDVLTGVIAGIAAQVPDLWAAATAGVLVHALAGDMAARGGERGLLASDVLARLPACVNPPLLF